MLRWLWLSLLLVVMGWGGFELWRDRNQLGIEVPAVQDLVLPQPSLPTMASMPALNTFSATVQRPLFFAERRLPKPSVVQNKLSVTETKVKVQPPRVQLTAILTDSQHQKIALLLSRQGQEHTLRLGDMIEGWRLTHIDKEAVVLVANEQKHQIKLYDFADDSPSQPSYQPFRR